MRKAFKEFEKLQGKNWKAREKQVKQEKKQQQQELRDQQKLFKTQEKQLKQLQREKEKRDKRDEQSRAKQRKFEDESDRRSKARSRRDKDHIDDVNRKMKQGPVGRMMGVLGRTAAFAGGGILGLVIGAALKGYQDYTQYQHSLAPSIGLGGRASQQASRSAKGGNLGFNIMERAQLMPMMGRATGVISPRAMMTAMRSTGMDAGEVGSMFSAIRQGGTQFEGQGDIMNAQGKTETKQFKGQGRREFERIMAAGMASGIEKARLPEFFHGVTTLMQKQQEISAGQVGGGDFARIAALLGRSGQAGFQGQRGMNIMGKLQQGILQPGGGDAGRAFMQQAMGFGRPGGGTGFYEAEKEREKGLTSDNFTKVMDELQRQYGTGQDAALKMRELFGVSLTQAEELIKISQTGNQDLQSVDKIMEASKTLEEQSLEAMKKAGTNLARLAGKFDKSVTTGTKAAKLIEKIEDWQQKLVSMLMEHIPKISAAFDVLIDVVKGLVDIVKAVAKKFGIGTDFFSAGENVNQQREVSGKVAKKLMGEMLRAPRGKREAMEQQLAQMGRRIFSAGGAGGSQFMDLGYSSQQLAKTEGKQYEWYAKWINDFYEAAGIDNPTARDAEEAKKHLFSAFAKTKVTDRATGSMVPQDRHKGTEYIRKKAMEYRNRTTTPAAAPKGASLSPPATGPKTAMAPVMGGSGTDRASPLEGTLRIVLPAGDDLGIGSVKVRQRRGGNQIG
jgi:hypothetical protein